MENVKEQSLIARTLNREKVVREVKGLKWVKLVTRPPFNILGPNTTAQRKGISFERKVVRHLKKELKLPVLHGPWLHFEDAQGLSYRQPDVVILGSDYAIVLESKYTQNQQGIDQLNKLYHPLVQMLWGMPTFKVLAYRNATCKVEPRFKLKSWEWLLDQDPRHVYNWHFIG